MRLRLALRKLPRLHYRTFLFLIAIAMFLSEHEKQVTASLGAVDSVDNKPQQTVSDVTATASTSNTKTETAAADRPLSPQELSRRELVASSVQQAETLTQALQVKDLAQINSQLGEQANASAAAAAATGSAREQSAGSAVSATTSGTGAGAGAGVGGSDALDSLSPELKDAARVGVAAAAPIVVTANKQAMDAAAMAAMMTADAGGSEDLQKAAAVAAAAAAAGNANISVNVSTPEVSLQQNASDSAVNKVVDELDKSISKLDLETPQRSLLSLTWPIFIDLSLHFATLIINTVMVGMVSVKAVAELTIGNQVFDLALIIFNFFNIGVCVVCAQALGANNKRLARRIIHIGLGVNLIIGTIVSAAIFMASGFIVDIMNVPPEIAESSHNYLQILSLSFLPLSICLVSSAILRAHNCTRDAMYVSMLVNVITICGNTLFLFGYLGVPVLGVEGVAISTVFSRTVACFVFIPLIIRRTRTHIIPRFMFIFRKKVIYSILSIGLPGAGENLSWHTQYMFLTGIIASMGAMALATQGIYFQIIQVLMLFSAAIGMGTELLVAHYTGAMKLDLANRQLIRSVKIGEVVTILLTFSMPLGTGALLVSCFTDNPEVLALATPLFMITVFQEPGRILNVIIINSLRATGDTKFPVIMAVISMWGISVPLGCFLGIYMGWGLTGIWLGFAADEWVRGIAMVLRWKSKAWHKAARRVYEQTLAMEQNRAKLKTNAEVQQERAAQAQA